MNSNRCIHCDARYDETLNVTHEWWCRSVYEPRSLGLGREDVCGACGRAGTMFILHAEWCPRPVVEGYRPPPIPSGEKIAAYLTRQCLPAMNPSDPREQELSHA